MSYIGQIPATTFLQKQSQSFTPDGSTTSFSLDHSVTNEKDLLVVVNNVIQEPGDGKAYTASANTLLMSEAPGSSDSMYCYYLGFTVGTINTPDGSVTKAKTNFITDTTSAGITSQGSGSQAGQIQLNCSANSHGIKLESPPHAVGQSYTLIYPENNVAAGTVLAVDSITGSGTTATGTLKFDKINTPAFSVYKSSSQSLSDNVNTKVSWNAEFYDTDSAFASDKFTVPSGKDGKYFLHTKMYSTCAGNGNFNTAELMFYKNGARIDYAIFDFRDNPGHQFTVQAAITLPLVASDYVEVYLQVDDTSGTPSISGTSTVTDGIYRSIFEGYKLNV